MIEKFPKWVLAGSDIIIGKVTFHKDLVDDPTTIKGGGMYTYNKETDSFVLFGSSFDFGPAKQEEVKEAILNDKVFTNNRKIYSIAKLHNFYWNTNYSIELLRQSDNITI